MERFTIEKINRINKKYISILIQDHEKNNDLVDIIKGGAIHV